MALQREEVLVESRAQWRTWLAAHAADSPGVWAVTWRRGADRPGVAYEDLVEEALCVGWIDSQARALGGSGGTGTASLRPPAGCCWPGCSTPSGPRRGSGGSRRR